MTYIKNFSILLLGLFLSTMLFSASGAKAQDGKKKKTETVKIKTSAECDMCKERLETALAYTAGVKKSDLDIESQIITVTYNPNKITADEIRKVIAKTGYDADDVKADHAAYDQLPDCCKKNAHGHH